MGLLMKILAIAISATLLAWPHAAMAQIKVVMSGGFSGAYAQLLPEFERTSGIWVSTADGRTERQIYRGSVVAPSWGPSLTKK